MASATDAITITIIDADDRESTVAAIRDGDRLLLPAEALHATLGWTLEPEGLCHGDVCVPTSRWPALVDGEPARIDLAVFGAATGQPVVIDAGAAVAAFGVAAGVRAERLSSLDAPDFAVDDLDGEPVTLADFAGRKKLLVAWASWCGCRHELPAWQQMYAELREQNFAIIGVALDERAEDARAWVDGVEFPVVLDRDHVITERYDIRNVPTVVWIDEHDRIVRPNDYAFGSDLFKEFHGVDSDPHHEALRRWVTTGELPLRDDNEVRAHLVTPSDDEQLARVHWRLAMFLHRDGQRDGAVQHWTRAGELAPHDLTIRRSNLPLQGIDPFLSDEFIAIYESYQAAGQPGYGFEHPRP
jgi:peroxiredoxin